MGVIMQLPHDAVLLRIFFGEDDRHGHMPIYEAVVLKAREMQLDGATVLRGAAGFGHSSHIHTAKILRLSQDLPIIVEIVDSREKIDAFGPSVSASERSVRSCWYSAITAARRCSERRI